MHYAYNWTQAFALLNFYCNKSAIIQYDFALLKYCIITIQFWEKCNNRNAIIFFWYSESLSYTDLSYTVLSSTEFQKNPKSIVQHEILEQHEL